MGYRFKILIPNVDRADDRPATHLTRKGSFQTYPCVSVLSFKYYFFKYIFYSNT